MVEDCWVYVGNHSYYKVHNKGLSSEVPPLFSNLGKMVKVYMAFKTQGERCKTIP